jgi:Fe-S cluster assembly scaffold protein SufB
MTITQTPDTGLDTGEIESLTGLGYGDESRHSGTCIVIDQGVRHISVFDDDVDILPIAEALQRYPWVQDLMYHLIPTDFDEHVREFAESTHPPVGHFIWVHEGADVTLPVQSFTLLETPQGRQFMHNITVVDKDATVTMISGSAVTEPVHTGTHVSISETYIREGATCHSVSIERWGKDMEVHSYARSHLSPGAHTTDTAIALSGLKNHYSNSVTVIEENASSSDQMVVFAPAGTRRVMDSEIRLAGAGANSESVTRMVTDGGDIANRSLLIGDTSGVSGYLGCDGLKLQDGGELLSSPSLLARTSDAQLSHEASIGKISQEKMAYLMATGMTEDNARALIVQGFLDLDQDRLPEIVRDQVRTMTAAAKTGSM